MRPDEMPQLKCRWCGSQITPGVSSDFCASRCQALAAWAGWPNVEAPTTAVGSTDSKSQSTAGGRPKETTTEMPEYDNSNTAVLFKNNQKHGDRDPSYKGEIHIGCTCGRTYSRRLVAWVKTSTKGTKVMSLSFKAEAG